MGLLELHPEGYGFLRSAARNWKRHADDPYVSRESIESLRLQAGDMLEAHAQPSRKSPGATVTPQAGRPCPECGNAIGIHKDGCDFCTACGYVGQCG